MQIRYPRITGRNTEQRLQQLEQYLHYLVEILNFVLRK